MKDEPTLKKPAASDTWPRDRAGRLAIVSTRCADNNLRRATRAVAQLYDAALAPLGLTDTQFTVMVGLSRHGTASISDLADSLSVDRTTLSRKFVPLVERGLVERLPGADARRRELRLTGAGNDLLSAALPRWRIAQSAIEQALGGARLDRLVGDLKLLSARLADMGN